MELLIGLSIIFLIMFVLGKAFQSDLNDLEKTNPKYRKHLKDKFDIWYI